MRETELLLRRVKAAWADENIWWNQKKNHVLEIIALCEHLGYVEPAVANQKWWVVNNPQRYPFSLPDLARFIVKQQDAALTELYQYVSKTYANSMYNTEQDNIQSIIRYHLDEGIPVPDIFWEGFVRDVDLRTLARLGKLLPEGFVGPVLARLFVFESDKGWGQPYLNLFHLYMTQRDDEWRDLDWEYLEGLYKPSTV